jgi:succinoglycan biosynthesis transport protein ExoP
MSNKFQLSTNTQSAADFWTQGSSNLPATHGNGSGAQSPPATPRSPMNKVHRLLRGRYPMAITLAAIGAVIGAGAGWIAVPPKYESSGSVNINPTIVGSSAKDDVIPLVNMYIQLQIGLITSPSVATDALSDPAFIAAWNKAYPSQPVPSPKDFIANIDTDHKNNAPLIKVTFSDRNKDVALAGTRAVMDAYKKKSSAHDFLDVNPKLKYNHDELEELDSELATKNNDLRELARKFGSTDLGERDKQMGEKLDDAVARLDVATTAYQNAKQEAEGKLGTKQDREVVYQKIADLPNEQMRSDLANREEARLNYDSDSAAYGQNNPTSQRTRQQLAAAQQRVEDYARQFLNANPDKVPGGLDNQGNGTLEALKQNMDTLQKTVLEMQNEAGQTNAQRRQIEQVEAEVARSNAQRAVDQNNINDLLAEQSLTKTIDIFDNGSEPQLSSDKRIIAAGAGFLFGGMLPISLLLLYGLSENRFRFSDDATSADLAGVTLLGILPNLPDRLSDPQQAGIAAHCVHQIRTMLQISRSNDEPQVIAITSASAGDGKTSLTLALGLSYAACGARTLLIDCDLLAAGLTHRLNVNSADGVLEAVANRALLEFVRTTDIADVAILPVGTTHAHHASTLSPVALRRLLSEARKNFDIVIVDTGPVLGSIEASLVCAAADRTILTVARNQQRPLVEKSIEHLQSIGSNLAGVVFNRANAADFAKSASGVGLRSRLPDGTPGGGAGHSTAASAVAGSFKRAG